MGSDNLYCTYLTIYSGQLLPKRYIGSSSIKRVLKGYHGSVKSKKFKTIYRNELGKNPHLFKTRILTRHSSQEEAISFELFLHVKYDVVKSSSYMNESLACPNGFFGKSSFGKDHQFFGKKHTEETRKKVSDGLKLAYLEGRAIPPNPMKGLKGELNPLYNIPLSDEHKANLRKPKSFIPKWKCAICELTYDGGNLYNHMKWKHGWTKEQITEYRKNTLPS
jgi:hypothetical protein